MSEPLRCPVCRADNAAGPQCRRCKADLSSLFEVREHRDVAVAQARAALAAGRTPQFVEAAETAYLLQHDDETRKLVSLARLLRGEYAGAARMAGLVRAGA